MCMQHRYLREKNKIKTHKSGIALISFKKSELWPNWKRSSGWMLKHLFQYSLALLTDIKAVWEWILQEIFL